MPNLVSVILDIINPTSLPMMPEMPKIGTGWPQKISTNLFASANDNEIFDQLQQQILNWKQEDERRGSGSVAVPVSRGTLVQGERGQVILHFLFIKKKVWFNLEKVSQISTKKNTLSTPHPTELNWSIKVCRKVGHILFARHRLCFQSKIWKFDQNFPVLMGYTSNQSKQLMWIIGYIQYMDDDDFSDVKNRSISSVQTALKSQYPLCIEASTSHPLQ